MIPAGMNMYIKCGTTKYLLLHFRQKICCHSLRVQGRGDEHKDQVGVICKQNVKPGKTIQETSAKQTKIDGSSEMERAMTVSYVVRCIFTREGRSPLDALSVRKHRCVHTLSMCTRARCVCTHMCSWNNTCVYAYVCVSKYMYESV
jgi:hypothetical protein